MDSAADSLLIIVSSTLAVFLIVAALALVFFIKLLRQLQRIADRAENVAESVESAAGAFEKTATPLAVLKLISNIVERANHMRRKRG